MMLKIKYVCRVCGAKWSRKVSGRSMQPLERPFSAICPGCRDDEEKAQDPRQDADK